MPFQNRADAAERLAQRLLEFKGKNPLVLAIPRGGVPIAAELAKRLEGDLDIVLVHKLGAPGHEEYAIGGVDERGQVTLNPSIAREELPPTYLQAEVVRQVARLKHKRKLLSGDRPPLDPFGRIVLLVDDGIATGSTMVTALKVLRDLGAQLLVAVAPVAPPDAISKLQALANRIVVLESPDNFLSVGQFYEDFSQVADEEVLASLRAFSPKTTQ